MSITPIYDTSSNHPVFRRQSPGGVDHVRSVIDLMPAYIELASRIANTEFVPGALRRRPEAVLAALMSGAERGLGPMQSLSSVHVIDGRPSLSAEAMRALVFAAGHQIEIVESTATKATVIGRRAGSESTSPPFTWTLDRARRARLAGKQNWQTYPEAMLLARASADLCRAVFPDVIAGLAVTEELEDQAEPEPDTVRRQPRRRLAPPPPAPSEPAAADAPTATSTVESPPPMSPTDLGGIPGADQPTWSTGSPQRQPDQPADPAVARRIHAELAQAFPSATSAERDRWRHALVAVVTRRRPDGPQASSTGISLEEQLALSKLVTNITAGQASVADGPDGTVELRAGGGWRYTITLDPLAVTTTRGDQEPAAAAVASDPPPAGEVTAEASPDQTSLDGLEGR